MAKRVIETLHSDLSGTEIPEDSAGGTVEFTVSGQGYAVDLTEDELTTFNSVLQPYVDAAQRLTSRGAPITRTRVTTGSGKRSKEELANVRDWAGKNGHTVGDRGRIPNSILEAYDAAH